MAEFNLLNSVPKIQRNVSGRLQDKETNRALAMQYGREYFDGTREQGYGGYVYDGRWVAVAETARRRYDLRWGDKVLDIGCAKGFFVNDLMQVIPGLEAVGLDISAYAIEHALPEAKPFLQLGSADALPYEDDSFDAVFAINTIHNLEYEACIKALREIVRVVKNPGRCFVQVDAYTSDAEKTLFEDWMLTAKTYATPEQWVEMFAEAGYRGDYYWTILKFEETR